VGWSLGLFILDSRLTFAQVRRNPQTSFLKKTDYLGDMTFDPLFLQTCQSHEIDGIPYYYEYLWEPDQTTVIKFEQKLASNPGDPPTGPRIVKKSESSKTEKNSSIWEIPETLF
jgi:hypothetical protein